MTCSLLIINNLTTLQIFNLPLWWSDHIILTVLYDTLTIVSCNYKQYYWVEYLYAVLLWRCDPRVPKDMMMLWSTSIQNCWVEYLQTVLLSGVLTCIQYTCGGVILTYLQTWWCYRVLPYRTVEWSTYKQYYWVEYLNVYSTLVVVWS